MPGGSWRNVLEIADCTSCAAASMLRDSVNCSVMLVLPSVLDDVMASSRAIVETCFSRGVATAAAIVCGLAPGRPAETVIVGKSTFGRSLTGSSRYAIIPNMRMPSITSVVATGLRINSPEMLTSRQLHPRRPFRSSVHRGYRSEEHTSELQSQSNLVCRLLLEKKKTTKPEEAIKKTTKAQA